MENCNAIDIMVRIFKVNYIPFYRRSVEYGTDMENCNASHIDAPIFKINLGFHLTDVTWSVELTWKIAIPAILRFELSKLILDSTLVM